MNQDIFEYKRKSYLQIGEIYFWTATIHKWQRLLEPDSYKQVIVDSLTYLSNAHKIDVFAFVIMPNHIHLIWRINDRNGKEAASSSFLKYTAHTFKQMLNKEENGEKILSTYAVHAANKSYMFWQRDALAIELYTPEVAFQKLDYLHNNPLAEHWGLTKDPCDYFYSTASYYEKGIKNFSFIKDLRDEF